MTGEEFGKINKLWQLLEVALHDFDEASRRDDVVIKMSSWLQHRQDNKCHICLAGAAMLGTLQANMLKDAYPEDYPYDIQCRLLALDSLRAGRIERAFMQLCHEPVDRLRLLAIGHIHISYYYDNAAAWRQDMANMLVILKHHDI